MCRCRFNDWPWELRKYDRTDLFVGHVVRFPELTDTARNDIQARFTGDKLVYSGGNKAVQWVFHGDIGPELGRQLRGKIFPDVHAAESVDCV